MAKREVKIATPGDEQQISDLAAAGLDASQIGRVMGLNITSVRSVLVAQNQRRAQTIQELLHVDFGKPLELSGDDWMITSDWHVPRNRLAAGGAHVFNCQTQPDKEPCYWRGLFQPVAV